MAWRLLLLALLMLAPLVAPQPASAADDEPFTEARLQELLQRNPATGLPVDSHLVRNNGRFHPGSDHLGP